MAILEKTVLTIMLVGSTHYVDIGKDTDAVIYYETDREVHMTLPDGPTLNGEWKLLADGYYVDWKDGPEGNWQIRHEPGLFAYVDGKGETVGTITRIVPGNPENF